MVTGAHVSKYWAVGALSRSGLEGRLVNYNYEPGASNCFVLYFKPLSSSSLPPERQGLTVHWLHSHSMCVTYWFLYSDLKVHVQLFWHAGGCGGSWG